MAEKKYLMFIKSGLTTCVSVTRAEVIEHFGLCETPTGLCYDHLIKQRDDAIAELELLKASIHNGVTA